MKINKYWEFPGGPQVSTWCCHCWGWVWSLIGELGSCQLSGVAEGGVGRRKQKEKRISKSNIWMLYALDIKDQSVLKEINTEYSLAELMLKLKLQYSGHLTKRVDSLEKTQAGKDWRQEKEMTEDEMVGWHHWLDGHESEQAPGDGEGQGSLVCCSPWGHRVGHNWVTEQCRDTRRWRRQVEFLNIGGNRHVMKFVGQWESIMFVVSASVMVVVMAVGRQRNDWGSRQAENIHGSCVCISQSPLPSKATYSFIHSVQFSLVAQLCPTLCDPMNRSMSGLPVHHHLPEFTQTRCC